MKQKIFLAVLFTAMLFTACKEEILAPDISGTETADYVLIIGDKLTLAPNITNLKGNDYVWHVNEKKVADATTHYIFVATQPGTFVVTFKASNKGGAADKAFKIVVEKPIDISFDKAIFVTPKCNILPIVPRITGPERNDYTYEWMLGDAVIGKEKDLDFISVAPGNYELKLTVSAGKQTETTTCNVKVEDAEYSKYPTSLVDVQFSPGNSVNWGYPFGHEKEGFIYPIDEYKKKISDFLQKNLSEEFNLGDWGGYAVFGFDHTIVNVQGENDIQVFVKDYNVSETAFFVAYDKNKNGKPDENEWYEIKSSNFGLEQIKDYEKTVTYKSTNFETYISTYEWQDNQKTAEGTYTKGISEGYQFPGLIWNETWDATSFMDTWKNTYTLKGRKIHKRVMSGMPGRRTYTINIGNAVDKNGEFVSLPGADFLKVQNISVIYSKDEPEPYIYYQGQKVSGIRDNHLR